MGVRLDALQLAGDQQTLDHADVINPRQLRSRHVAPEETRVRDSCVAANAGTVLAPSQVVARCNNDPKQIGPCGDEGKCCRSESPARGGMGVPSRHVEAFLLVLHPRFALDCRALTNSMRFRRAGEAHRTHPFARARGSPRHRLSGPHPKSHPRLRELDPCDREPRNIPRRQPTYRENTRRHLPRRDRLRKLNVAILKLHRTRELRTA